MNPKSLRTKHWLLLLLAVPALGCNLFPREYDTYEELTSPNPRFNVRHHDHFRYFDHLSVLLTSDFAICPRAGVAARPVFFSDPPAGPICSEDLSTDERFPLRQSVKTITLLLSRAGYDPVQLEEARLIASALPTADTEFFAHEAPASPPTFHVITTLDDQHRWTGASPPDWIDSKGMPTCN